MKSNKMKLKTYLPQLFLNLFMIMLSIAFLLPLWTVLMSSVSSPGYVQKNMGWVLWPHEFHTDAYKIVFANINVINGFKNTFFYMTAGTALTYIVTFLSAYPLSKKNFKAKKAVMIYFMITMYFSGGLIPYYLLIQKLGLFNSPLVLIIPGAVSVWNIIILRTRFLEIPESLIDAANIDGASDFVILFRIFLPLSKAVSAVLILFTLVGYWNMWFEPLMFLSDRRRLPLQSVLRQILIQADKTVMKAGIAQAKINLKPGQDLAYEALIKYANIIVSTLPILCIYPFIQKYFVKGVMVGSIKS